MHARLIDLFVFHNYEILQGSSTIIIPSTLSFKIVSTASFKYMKSNLHWGFV